MCNWVILKRRATLYLQREVSVWVEVLSLCFWERAASDRDNTVVLKVGVRWELRRRLNAAAVATEDTGAVLGARAVPAGCRR